MEVCVWMGIDGDDGCRSRQTDAEKQEEQLTERIYSLYFFWNDYTKLGMLERYFYAVTLCMSKCWHNLRCITAVFSTEFQLFIIHTIVLTKTKYQLLILSFVCIIIKTLRMYLLWMSTKVWYHAQFLLKDQINGILKR